MAFGFPPKHVREFYLDGLNPKQFLVLAIEAALSLDWTVSEISESRFVVHKKMSKLSWNTSMEVLIEEDFALLISRSAGYKLIDWGENKKNITQFIERFDQIRVILSNETIASKYEVLKGSIVVNETVAPKYEVLKGSMVFEEGYVQDEQESMDMPGLSTVLNLFIPVEGFFITPILLSLNIIIFIMMMVISGGSFMNQDIESLTIGGVNFSTLTTGEEFWKLLASCFIDNNVIYLLISMGALIYIGEVLEPILGRIRFLSAYVLAGIVSQVTSLYFNGSDLSFGSFGAVLGMYGVFFALLTTNLFENNSYLFEKNSRKRLLIAIVFFFIFVLFAGEELKRNSIIAHFGGLLSGLVVGYVFLPGLQYFNSLRIKFLTGSVLAVVFPLVSFFVYSGVLKEKVAYNELLSKYTKEREEIVNENQTLYNSKMDEFYALEDKAMAIYDQFSQLKKEQVISELQENGVKNWERALKITEELGELNLPEPLIRKNLKLKEYCELRIERYNLTIKLMQKPSDTLQKEIAKIDEKTDAISILLNGWR